MPTSMATEVVAASDGPLAPWEIVDLPAPPRLDRRRWPERIGPGIIAERAAAPARRGGFSVRSDEPADETRVSVEGRIRPGRDRPPERVTIRHGSQERVYSRMEDVPAPYGELVRSWVADRGFERVGLWEYWRRHGRPPELDRSLLAAFAAIAGAGGLSNALFSDYARDKGWGMGARIGAIPSAVGGRSIELSHVGMVFPVNDESLGRWRRWY